MCGAGRVPRVADHGHRRAPDQEVRRQDRCRRPLVHRPPGRRHRVPRPERRREVDHDAHARGARPAHVGTDHRRWAALPRPARPAAARRHPPRRRRGAPGAQRTRPPPRDRAHALPPRTARRRGARPRRPGGRRAQARRRVLAGHGAAARDRGRPARRPAGARARRAGQRAGPRRRAVGPADARGPRGGRAHRVPLLAPHERAVAHRRRPRRHRPGAAPRGGHGPGRHRVRRPHHGARRLARRRRARDGPAGRRRQRDRARPGEPRRPRALGARDRRARGCPGDRPVRARHPTHQPGGGVHADHSRRRRVRHRHGGRPMTAVTLPEPRTDLAGARITAAGLLRSEWTKVRSVRSLRVTLAAAFALVLGLSGYVVLEGTALDGAPADIPFSFTAVYPIGTLALVVLGVLAVTSEYSSGTVRVSMVAAPRRAGVPLAKAVVPTAVTAGLAVVSSVLLYLLVQVTGTLPAARGVSLLDPEMLGGVLANTLLLPYGALFGVVLGALVRDAAGAITLYFGVFQLGPQI